MTYLQLALLHLATVVPAFAIGLVIFAMKKGTPYHKQLGRFYVLLMLFTAVITLFMPAHVGPVFLNHFGYIHLLSLLVLVCLPLAVWAARKGDMLTHKLNMLGVFIGGILIAGTLALMPGRLLHGWLFT